MHNQVKQNSQIEKCLCYEQSTWISNRPRKNVLY